MPLLERERPLADLQTTLQLALEGTGAVVAVTGEAGIGKTSLLAELLARIEVPGQTSAESRRGPVPRVLLGGCEALFTPRPFGPFHDIASELPIDLDMRRDRLFPVVQEALGARPTLLAVEDVHWADRATLDLLKYLARRISRLPVLLLVTYRDDEVGSDHPLITFLGETPVRRIRLERLSPEAVARLAGSSATDLYHLTGGNPFYVTEVLASPEEGIPPTVRDAVLARVAPLPAGARRVVEVASLIPARAELDLLEEEEGDIESAARSGIVRVEGDSLLFRHELGRRAVEDSLSDARRSPMHRRILDRLLARGEPSLARLAHHAVGARDVAAIQKFAPLAAVEAANADAHREAAAHYRNALSWTSGLDQTTRADLLEALAYECYLTEQLGEALERRTEALQLRLTQNDARRAGDNLRWQSRLLWFLGRNAESREKAEQAIAMLEPIEPRGSELAMAYSNRAQLHMLAQEEDETIRWGTRAIELATAIGDDLILAHALNNVGVAEMQRGAGAEKLENSLCLSLERGFQEHAARAWTNLGSECVRLGDFETARRYLDEGIAWCRDRDLDSWVLYMTAWRARLALETGDWTLADELAQRVLSHSGASVISRIPSLVVAGQVVARRGHESAAALLDEALRLAAPTGEFQRLAPVAIARGELAWLEGRTEEIAATVQSTFEMSESVDEPWTRGALALLLWRAGALASPPPRIAEAYALQIAGNWREAATQFHQAGRPWECALALGSGDDPQELQRSLDILARLGDGAANVLVRQKLRALGIRGPRSSTRANPAGLTARELEILHLLEEGLRNAAIAERLHVSAKTVDHHVSSILGKLNVKTRGEAVHAWRTQMGSQSTTR